MNWHSPIIRLTAGYTVIIMCISLFFSLALDRLMSQQVDVGLHRQAAIFAQRRFPFPGGIDPYDDVFLQAQVQEIQSRTRMTLVTLNAVILGIAGTVSYLLARRTLKPIQANLEAQRRFTADASHELRTPLASMKTEIEVALHQASPPEHARVLKSNLEEIGKLEHLSTSLLTLARHEDSDQPAPRTTVDIRSVADQAVRRVSALAERKGVTIERDGSAGAVIGDETGLIDLLVIILDNAIKYSPTPSTVRLAWTWSRRHVAVTIVDHGVGIKAVDLPNVWQRFYRADSSRSKEKTDGYGLGLPIAKQIAERHRGSIDIASELDEGTTVTVVLPRRLA